jgi:glycosyltransferase involved in cell wall biosynthesis
VMPSECEPFGMAYVEAAAASVPSIGTTVGGAADILGDDGGVLVAPGDEAALRDAMRRLADPGASGAMGEAAHRRAERFTWAAVAGRLLRALAL